MVDFKKVLNKIFSKVTDENYPVNIHYHNSNVLINNDSNVELLSDYMLIKSSFNRPHDVSCEHVQIIPYTEINSVEYNQEVKIG